MRFIKNLSWPYRQNKNLDDLIESKKVLDNKVK